MVVAPITCICPLASAGFKIFPASIAPSAAPAPTSKCISSIKTIVFVSAINSSMTFLRRSSNSPRYLVPATIAAKSNTIMRLSSRLSGTSSDIIFWARPSTTAVLPTPGSPINTGLFLVRRFNIVIKRLTTPSRPTTGSSLPLAASSVKSVPKYSSAVLLDRFLDFVAVRFCPSFSLSYCCLCKNCSSSSKTLSVLTFISRSNTVAREFF